jgi:GTPase SAR1 family protein
MQSDAGKNYNNNNHHDNEQNLQNTALGFIVDLPGYGYATSPEHIVSEWQKQVQEFLLMRRDSNNLKRLFLLQDSRTGALALDLTVQNWLNEASIPYTIVFTKTDCVSPSHLIKQINLACMRYHHHYTDYEYHRQRLQEHNDMTFNIDDDGHDPHLTQFQENDRNDLRPKISPFIYATSSKSNEGIDELLQAIDTEFIL